MKKLKKYIHLFLSIPNTLKFNFLAFDLKTAITFPIIVSYKTKIINISKNAIELKDYKEKKYKVYFGIGGSDHIISNQNSVIRIGNEASIIFKGKTKFAEGCSLRCDNGILSFGKNISFNKNCIIDCECGMNFGDNLLCGFDCMFIDSDGHKIIEEGKANENKKKIEVGENVWICGKVNVLKGSKINNESVVAFNSLVLKTFDEKNILIAGTPAKVIKKNIKWER